MKSPLAMKQSRFKGEEGNPKLYHDTKMWSEWKIPKDVKCKEILINLYNVTDFCFKCYHPGLNIESLGSILNSQSIPEVLI